MCSSIPTFVSATEARKEAAMRVVSPHNSADDYCLPNTLCNLDAEYWAAEVHTVWQAGAGKPH